MIATDPTFRVARNKASAASTPPSTTGTAFEGLNCPAGRTAWYLRVRARRVIAVLRRKKVAPAANRVNWARDRGDVNIDPVSSSAVGSFGLSPLRREVSIGVGCGA